MRMSLKYGPREMSLVEGGAFRMPRIVALEEGRATEDEEIIIPDTLATQTTGSKRSKEFSLTLQFLTVTKSTDQFSTAIMMRRPPS